MSERWKSLRDGAGKWGARFWQRARFIAGSLAVLLVLGVATWLDWSGAAKTRKRMQWVAIANRRIEAGAQIDAADVTIGFQREVDSKQRARPDKVVGSFVYVPLDAGSPVNHEQIGPNPLLKPEAGEYLVPVTVTGPSAAVLRPGMQVLLRKGKEEKDKREVPGRVVHVAHKADGSTPSLVVVALKSTLDDVDGWAVAITTVPAPPPQTP